MDAKLGLLTGERFMTVEEVAELCRVAPRTVRWSADTGRVKARKVGWRGLFRERDLAEVLGTGDVVV